MSKFNLKKNSRIFIAGHQGLIGSAIYDLFKSKKFTNILTRSRKQLNLLSQLHVENFFKKYKPEIVILATGLNGGIYFNKNFPNDLISQNLQIQNNIFNAAKKNEVNKLIFFGSSCVYSQKLKQPFNTKDLLKAKPDTNSLAYAVAKISGIYFCQSYNQQHNNNTFITLIPNTVYGFFDNFDKQNSHVLSSLIRKMHEAKINNINQVELWGNGKPLREFIYSYDVALACYYVLRCNRLKNSIFNIGSGHEVSIKNLALLISKIIGFKGKIIWNKKYPNGVKRKLLNSRDIKALGWSPKIELKEGISLTYKWFKNNYNNKIL